MVADAIGTERSLLIVCQKQAALEVVYKRLTATGLGDRIVMVNDVNRDREPVIRAIREQIEAIWQRPGGATGWKQQRAQTASRIETLERVLDGQHAAHHAVDEPTGLSYRLILGDLIALADEGPAVPSVPALRSMLGQFNPAVSPLFRKPARQSRDCGFRPAMKEVRWQPRGNSGLTKGRSRLLRVDLALFADAERNRLTVIERTPDALPVDDPGPYRDWTMSMGRRCARSSPKGAHGSRAG